MERLKAQFKDLKAKFFCCNKSFYTNAVFTMHMFEKHATSDRSQSSRRAKARRDQMNNESKTEEDRKKIRINENKCDMSRETEGVCAFCGEFFKSLKRHLSGTMCG